MFSKEGHILIVDDIVAVRKMIKRAFATLGYKNLWEANDGEQAWAMLNDSEISFDLICSDWTMPKCTGMELLAKLRASDRHVYLPFLLLTGTTDASEVDKALEAA